MGITTQKHRYDAKLGPGGGGGGGGGGDHVMLRAKG